MMIVYNWGQVVIDTGLTDRQIFNEFEARGLKITIVSINQIRRGKTKAPAYNTGAILLELKTLNQGDKSCKILTDSVTR